MSTTKTTTKKTSTRSTRNSRPSRAKTKARAASNNMTSINTNYARVALMLIAVNVAFTGYVLYKIMALSN